MSIDLVAGALWLEMEPSTKLVLVALCERADLRTGKCWPGREEIAARASLSTRRVGLHLQALQRDGYVKSARRGSARHGETTLRTLAVQRILSEGEARRQAFLEARRSLGDEASLDVPEQGTLSAASGDVRGIDQGTFGNDQGTLSATLGDAASQGTVKEPSRNRQKEPSIEPSREIDLRRLSATDLSPAATEDGLRAIWDEWLEPELGAWSALSVSTRRTLLREAAPCSEELVEHVIHEAITVTTPNGPGLVVEMLRQHRDNGCGIEPVPA